MRSVVAVLIHIDRFQCVIYPFAYFIGRYAEIFECERNVFFNNSRYYLVVGILENHSDSLTYIVYPALVCRIYAVNKHLARGGKKNAVEVLRKGRLAASVMAKHSYEAALFYRKVYVGKNAVLACFIAVFVKYGIIEYKVFGFNYLVIFQSVLLCRRLIEIYYSGVSRRHCKPCLFNGKSYLLRIYSYLVFSAYRHL